MYFQESLKDLHAGKHGTGTFKGSQSKTVFYGQANRAMLSEAK